MFTCNSGSVGRKKLEGYFHAAADVHRLSAGNYYRNKGAVEPLGLDLGLDLPCRVL